MKMEHRFSYIVLPLVTHSALIYGLNNVHSIHWCALFFSIFTLHILYIAEKTSLKTALYIHSTSILINLLTNMNALYYIQGQPIQKLYIASYFSGLLSISLGLFVFTKTKEKHSNMSRYLFSSMLISFADGISMMLFFIPIYSIERVLHIFMKEVSYKTLYTALILTALYGVRFCLAKMRPSKMQVTPKD